MFTLDGSNLDCSSVDFTCGFCLISIILFFSDAVDFILDWEKGEIMDRGEELEFIEVNHHSPHAVDVFIFCCFMNGHRDVATVDSMHMQSIKY